jgi:hypothetical protein
MLFKPSVRCKFSLFSSVKKNVKKSDKSSKIRGGFFSSLNLHFTLGLKSILKSSPHVHFKILIKKSWCTQIFFIKLDQDLQKFYENETIILKFSINSIKNN